MIESNIHISELGHIWNAIIENVNGHKNKKFRYYGNQILI